MKKLFLVFNLIAAVFVFTNGAFAQELKWYDFKEGYKKAVSENKVLLIDVYTDWCGWCKVMDKKTYSNKEVITAINKNFVAIKLNPEKDATYDYNGKKYTGSQLVNVLTNNNLTGYPTTCFHNTKTKKTIMEVGYKDDKAMIPILAKYAKMK